MNEKYCAYFDESLGARNRWEGRCKNAAVYGDVFCADHDGVEVAAPWIKGFPKERGMYLTRFISISSDRSWIFLHDLVPANTYPQVGRDLFMHHTGGSYEYDDAIRRLGDYTHYCVATPENFAAVYLLLEKDKEKVDRRVEAYKEKLKVRTQKE